MKHEPSELSEKWKSLHAEAIREVVIAAKVWHQLRTIPVGETQPSALQRLQANVELSSTVAALVELEEASFGLAVYMKEEDRSKE